MANYSREEMEGQGKALVGVGVAALLGLASLAVKAVEDNNQKQNAIANNQRINSRIMEIDSEIVSLKGGFMGNWLNADRISELEREKNKLREERNKEINKERNK